MNRERLPRKWFVALPLVATLSAGSIALSSSAIANDEPTSRPAGMDTVDACTQPAPTDCQGLQPDCEEICGFCWRGPLCDPDPDTGGPL